MCCMGLPSLMVWCKTILWEVPLTWAIIEPYIRRFYRTLKPTYAKAFVFPIFNH